MSDGFFLPVCISKILNLKTMKKSKKKYRRRKTSKARGQMRNPRRKTNKR